MTGSMIALFSAIVGVACVGVSVAALVMTIRKAKADALKLRRSQ